MESQMLSVLINFAFQFWQRRASSLASASCNSIGCLRILIVIFVSLKLMFGFTDTDSSIDFQRHNEFHRRLPVTDARFVCQSENAMSMEL